jgi:hypothetical protein
MFDDDRVDMRKVLPFSTQSSATILQRFMEQV